MSNNITDKTNEVKLLDQILDKLVEAKTHSFMGRRDQANNALNELWNIVTDFHAQEYIWNFEEWLSVKQSI